MHQAHDVLGRFVLEHAAHGLGPKVRVDHFVGNFPAGRKAQLQAEALRDLDEEAVQRAHAEPVQVADQRAEHVEAASPIQADRVAIGERDVDGQLGQVFRFQRGIGQADQHAIENLTGRLAREGRGQDSVQRLVGRQADEPVAQLERLAGAGRRPNNDVGRSCAHDAAAPSGSSPMAPPNRSSWQIRRNSSAKGGGGLVGGQNCPALTRRTTSAAARSASPKSSAVHSAGNAPTLLMSFGKTM